MQSCKNLHSRKQSHLPKKLKRRQAVTFWYLDPVFTCFLTSLGARCVWRPSETGQCPARCWAAILHPDQGQRVKAWWLHHWILDPRLQSQITSDCRQSGGCVRIFQNVLSAQLWRAWVCNWMQLINDINGYITAFLWQTFGYRSRGALKMLKSLGIFDLGARDARWF